MKNKLDLDRSELKKEIEYFSSLPIKDIYTKSFFDHNISSNFLKIINSNAKGDVNILFFLLCNQEEKNYNESLNKIFSALYNSLLKLSFKSLSYLEDKLNLKISKKIIDQLNQGEQNNRYTQSKYST